MQLVLYFCSVFLAKIERDGSEETKFASLPRSIYSKLILSILTLNYTCLSWQVIWAEPNYRAIRAADADGSSPHDFLKQGGFLSHLIFIYGNHLTSIYRHHVIFCHVVLVSYSTCYKYFQITPLNVHLATIQLNESVLCRFNISSCKDWKAVKK